MSPRRERRLLLHRQEIRKLRGKVAERGWTIVPLRMYLKDGLAKVEIALVRGKRLYDKKDSCRRAGYGSRLAAHGEGSRLRLKFGEANHLLATDKRGHEAPDGATSDACLHIRRDDVRIDCKGMTGFDGADRS